MIGPSVVLMLPNVVSPTPEVFVRFPRFALIVMEPAVPFAIILLSVAQLIKALVLPVALETAEMKIGPFAVEMVSVYSSFNAFPPELAALARTALILIPALKNGHISTPHIIREKRTYIIICK